MKQNNWNNWFNINVTEQESGKILKYGNLLGLNYSNGKYYGSNFERGLLLRQIIRSKKPKRILELGTGRGFGTICMADCIVSEGLNCSIETIDCISASTRQSWPHAKKAEFFREDIAVDEFWSKEFNNLKSCIKMHCGKTSDVIIQLLKESKEFDFIFMDAAHDLASVFLDLSGGIALLATGGCMLLDDFAPMESFGTATCIAVKHVKKYFSNVEIIDTEGTVYNSEISPQSRRSMVFLENKNNLKTHFNPSFHRVMLLRVFGRMLEWLHSPAAFKV